MKLQKRRKTPTVKIGNIPLGSSHPIVIQSMTNTLTSNIKSTVSQIKELVEAGSEIVRVTVNDQKAAKAVIEIIKILRDQGITAPIVGDFHFNGHLLLTKYPKMASCLDKYRINPGNLGIKRSHDENFSTIIKAAIDNKKPIRIGVNWGSLDKEVLKSLMDKNSKQKNPKSYDEITVQAMIKSAIDSAQYAMRLGLTKNRIILSAKMSNIQNLIHANTLLSEKCDFPLHIGLTEAGSDIHGISASAIALGLLLQQGIGDTIRVSLTPRPGIPRSREVEVCKSILQSMGLRYFEPSVTSCPGCGRTKNDFFQILADDIKKHIKQKNKQWKKQYPGSEKLTIAVMGCVVNGPGESKHADIGISLPGISEKPIAPVYIKGKKVQTLTGNNIKKEFTAILEKFIAKHYS